MFVISVIIPVYNVEKYVYRCLNSVIMQLENDIEIIIVNDGSTDNSVKICENAISNLPSKQIKLITQKNFGLSSARNRGIKEATGKYVMFLDSDDELKPEALRILKKSIKEKPDVDVFYYDAVVQDEIMDGKRRNGYDRKKKVPPNIKINSNEYFIEYYVDTLIVSACLCLIKKSLLNKFHIKFEEGKIYEDNLFSFELILNSNYVCYLPYDLYMRRYRAESITTRKITYKDIEDISYIIRGYLQKFERVLKLGDVALFNSFIALIYKTYVFGKEKMSRERWDLECMNKLPKEISRMLLDVPLKYRSLTYYLFMYKINKSNEFIVYIQEGYRRLLDKLKEHAEKRISIYGMGMHTNVLLQILKDNNLQIADKFIYIDSYKTDGIDEQNRTIINISNAEGKTDLIIISSYYYRLEMLQMCKKYAPSIKVFDFYKDEKMNLFDEDCLGMR